ncbi:MAG: hypothetical protein A2639_01710 [Candidatus Staskawiczbacteria bacterium RIFCSPHIGHO2_01_FULL_34_27]|uniref:Uncharacterized protein n=1 Tax=Candidatus Staskawiczbacteria bacterium RIFCSPHIGHO2_01_FULL_34_27 TaxID=1802199 RepID=A0A1G2HJ50_9BACT|nr:MAG: hypothetical protein A2639_01710 [Candidatus Staskawiczbacteria bacterium RIFCSPHIGHO2_01_FULL_34_27]
MEGETIDMGGLPTEEMIKRSEKYKEDILREKPNSLRQLAEICFQDMGPLKLPQEDKEAPWRPVDLNNPAEIKEALLKSIENPYKDPHNMADLIRSEIKRIESAE